MWIPVIGHWCFVLILMVDSAVPQGLYQLLATNGLTEFQRIVNSSYATQELLSAPSVAVTVFVPTNEAIARWRLLHRVTAVNSDILQNHIAPGTWSESKLKEIAQAPLKQTRRLRSGYLNGPLWIRHLAPVYRGQAKTFVNNALIVSPKPYQIGQQIMYIIDDIIAPTGSSVTAATFLSDPAGQMHPEVSLDEMRREVEQLTQVSALKQTDAVFTFFLPHNAAFLSLKNRGAFDEAVLRGHIVPDEVLFLRMFGEEAAQKGYSTLLNGQDIAAKSIIGCVNVSGETQIFSHATMGGNRLPEGRIYANVIKANIPVLNGVIHVIDRVLLIVEQNAREILETRRNLFKFREWFNTADPRLLDGLRTDDDMTLFIPTNKAISALPLEKINQLRNDRQFLEKILNMHIVPQRLLSDGISNATAVFSQQGQRLSFEVRPIHPPNSKEIFVEAGGARARILEPDLLSTNAVIHIIDEVLGLPFMNVLEKLRADPNLRRTYKYVEGSKEMTNSLASGHSNYTLFAPSNQAWSNLRPQDRDLLNASPELLNKVLKRHTIAHRRVDLQNFRNGQLITTMHGELRIKQLQDTKETLIEWEGHAAKLTTSDMAAANGVIHVIDQVLFDRGTDARSSSQKFTRSSSVSCAFFSIFCCICFKIFS